ncbi:hypothetical protein [Reinekea thalattae]|uniref:DUF4393 domain-containing protein n=1 Tax=Reinekea thalattae TaxID=2593301 RepID=A0A5C8Z9P5_9GAMM|nr:hypothetical protein [Reinekea thalattae]TXR53973.1 hypothetical protein FME95_05335 [Reinekea thalattae]
MSSDKLKTNKLDIGLAVSRSVVGAIPVAGTVLNELLSMTIPNQRLDRVTDFIRQLEQRIENSELETLKNNQYFIDLLEDSIQQSIKSLTNKRNEYLVTFLSLNKDIDQSDFSVKKKLLNTLEALTDKDIEILMSFRDIGYHGTRNDNYIRQETIGTVRNYTDRERYKYELGQATWSAHINALESYKLIFPVHKLQPEDDPDIIQDYIDPETGLAEIDQYKISELGKVLLIAIGL